MAELDALISSWTSRADSDALLATLSEHGVPAGKVYTAPDILEDPHYRAREMVLRAVSRGGLEVPMTGIVPKFSRTPGGVRDVGPALGEHTEEILAAITGSGGAGTVAAGKGGAARGGASPAIAGPTAERL